MIMAIASMHLASALPRRCDVDRAVDSYTTYLGFTLGHSGPTSSGTRLIPELSTPVPDGWNRIHLIAGDISAEVARARAAGLSFPNNIIRGRVGQQILLHGPAGKLIELFHPVNR